MKLGVRVYGWWDDLRDSLWLVPAVTLCAVLLLGALLPRLEPPPGWVPDFLLFGGTPDGARAILSQLAGATITVVGLVFSLTVVALQMAASQLTPRLLRTFLRARSVQVVLSGMIGSAVFNVAVLTSVRSIGEGVTPFVPRLAVSVALLFALVAITMLIYFLHHVTQRLRVDVVMRDIAHATVAQLERLPLAADRLPDQDGSQPPEHATALRSRVDGYLQLVGASGLAAGARALDLRVHVRPTHGAWVSRGTTLAWVWREDGQRLARSDEAETLVHRHIHLGADRTETSDLAFGLRQLQDISMRALSPGVNDPTTAVQAIGQMSAVLCRFALHPLGDEIVEDPDGQARVIVPRPGFPELLELVVGGSRRCATGEPDVIAALLALLLDLAELVADSADRREALVAQLERVLGSADLADAADRDQVEHLGAMVRRAVTAGSREPDRALAS